MFALIVHLRFGKILYEKWNKNCSELMGEQDGRHIDPDPWLVRAVVEEIHSAMVSVLILNYWKGIIPSELMWIINSETSKASPERNSIFLRNVWYTTISWCSPPGNAQKN